ncbi:MAG: peptidylprolyl isomerase [Erythrobacter sp.]|jgi:cyclophilin family peptidyl-prolyl cis-trans isomerase|uniref:peptidylprolyl isomerase n=1 Tax=Qipengyuania citrea TaxID=225971 RepID=UPI00209FE10A|nr:peptidylprolyl isomerase [Qipengyuania citrea]MCP2017507.1 peptidylprolyl isomerase [Qipengyuania citrea]MDE0901580.1 peptidylprolyl isomerase [Erythrobacter sp.]
MTRSLLPLAALLALGSPVMAQEETAAPSPNQIVEEAAHEEWVAIAPEDLLVMTLAPAADGSTRRVVIQLMPAPFSQGWVENIRTLARAGWYDGITVNRVQDNYVVQWGDPNYDNPEAEGKAKPLPEGLEVMGEAEYTTPSFVPPASSIKHELQGAATMSGLIAAGVNVDALMAEPEPTQTSEARRALADRYSRFAAFTQGWPIGGRDEEFWPVHCYGMVGVGRGMSPDTGSGAELYTVIGHAPRHLDRNIALVGRIVDGMEHLSSLPRGSGALGFYTTEESDKRTPILSVRLASDLPEAERPAFEYLSTESETFARYADARANRRDPFFIQPAGGADICNIPVPVRRVAD